MPGFSCMGMITWRKGVRRVLKLPFCTHNWLLPALLGRPSLQCSLECRFARFFASLTSSPNGIARFMALRASHDGSSPLGRNAAHLKYRRNVEDFRQVDTTLALIRSHHQPDPGNTVIIIDLAHELMCIRDNELYVEDFNELDLILRDICCN